MKINRIEPVMLRTPMRRLDAQNWVQQQIAGRPSYLVITPGSWITVPMKLFPIVVLEYTLNHASDLEDMRSMVSDALSRTEEGGSVVAISRACDNGQELAERMLRSGVTSEDMGVGNLTNAEIGRLRPQDVVLLTGSSVFKPTDSSTDDARFMEWASEVRQSSRAPDIRFQPERLVTRIVDVGMSWRKQ